MYRHPMDEKRKATHDLELEVRVVKRHPLFYRRGADESIDRPCHVRAGSALARLGGSFVIVQDDALFLAVIDASTLAVEDVPLPSIEGVRTFDTRRGNKSQKLDLEACFVDQGLFFALGSGGNPIREKVLVARDLESATPHIATGYAREFYAAWRGMPNLTGAELNIEGAVAHEGHVLVFQRGNGVSPAVDSIVWFPRETFVRYLTACAFDEERIACPGAVKSIVYDLGTVQGVRLTFTDGAIDTQGRVAFLAAAEQSPDSFRDGPTAGVALGLIDDESHARLTLIRDESGKPLTEKAEGLVFDPENPSRALLVVDSDDPDAPCELCELSLA